LATRGRATIALPGVLPGPTANRTSGYMNLIYYDDDPDSDPDDDDGF